MRKCKDCQFFGTYLTDRHCEVLGVVLGDVSDNYKNVKCRVKEEDIINYQQKIMGVCEAQVADLDLLLKEIG